MSNLIVQTVGGNLFDPMEPDPELIKIEEIAHALSQLCRFSGHTGHFYSVAQHSVMAFRVASKLGSANVALAALMHDASEAYLGDVTRPIKRKLGHVYTEMEDIVMQAIADKFRFAWPMPEEVKLIDNNLLETEFVKVMNGKNPACPRYGSLLDWVDLEFQEWTPRKAKREFLLAFDFLTEQLEFDFSQKEAFNRAMKGYKEASSKVDPPEHTRGADAYFRSLDDGTR